MRGLIARGKVIVFVVLLIFGRDRILMCNATTNEATRSAADSSLTE